MRYIWKRCFAALLAVAMAFAMLSATALAEEADGATGQTAVEQVQALIDELPDAEEITADNRADVEARLAAIDEAKLALADEELDALDITRYTAAEAILALDSMSGADKPATITVEAGYDVTEDSVVIDGDGECTITGTSNNVHTITVESGTVKITLNNVTVTNSTSCAFNIKGGDVTLILNGENRFESGNYYAGIHVAEGASLTIEGPGTLYAVSKKISSLPNPYDGTLGAGIGGNGGTNEITTEDNAGSITIKSGTIHAISEGDGAGIGGGWTFENGKKHGQFQSITITGGTVYAESERNGAGIGCGCWATEMGTITISGGTVHAKTAATNRQSYDIGAAHGDNLPNGGSIAITGGVVYTESGRGIGVDDDALTQKDAIIFSSNGNGKVYGNATLDSDLTIESGQTLHIPEGSSLTVSEGHTLTVESGATLENDGVLDNKGTVNGDGTATGSGEVKGNEITTMGYYVSVTVPAFESVREGYDQPEAQAITIQNKGTNPVTISNVSVGNVDFTVEPAGSTSVEVQLPSGGKCESYKISPNAGLPSGIHTATVTVIYDGDWKAAAKVSFMVHHFAEGEGTPESPYQIRNLEELKKFRDFINDMENRGGEDMYFELTQDIDMSSEYGPEKSSWTPIGADSNLFMGTFDGGGHRISGLYINSTSESETMSLQGLFGGNVGTIRNLNVSGIVSGGGESFAGMIVGMNAGTVTGCSSAGSITAEDSTGSAYDAGGMVGGIVGANLGVVKDCNSTAHVAVTVVGGSETRSIACGVGGIVGVTGDNSVIQNCSFSGKVTGSASGGAGTGTLMITAGIGGVVGLNQASDGAVTVESCSNSGAVSGNGSCETMTDAMTGVGGIMGLNMSGGGIVVVKNCLNTGTVSDGINGTVNGAGGIVGTNLSTDPENAVVGNCCNTGTVTGTGGATFGAVVGVNSVEMSSPIPLSGKVTNCYYLSGTSADGIGEGEGEATEKTADEFASGEVAWLLQKEQDPQAWGQALASDSYPVLTSAAEKAVHKVSFMANDLEYAVMYANSAGLTTLPDAPEKDGMTFAGWSTAENGPVDFKIGTPVTADVTLYPIYEEIPSADAALRGKVTEGGLPVAGANVTLRQGGKDIHTAVTGAGGSYFFEDVEPGIYEVVVEKDGKTMTTTVTVNEEAGTEKNLTMPYENVNSKLEVKGEDTPAVVVDGLDDVARDSADPDPGKTVTVTMTVEAVADGAADSNVQTAIDAIKDESESSEHEYLNLSVEKTVSEEGVDDVTTKISETKNLITVVIPFDPSGKSNIVVYRYHSGSVDTLTRDENSDGEYIDVGDSAVTVYTKNFSTYAIGYTQEGKTSGASGTPSYSITIPSKTEGGTVGSSLTAARPGSSVTLTARPDEGYHLGSLTVTDGSGRAVELTDNGDGTYTFTQPYGQVAVKAEFVKCVSMDFADVDVKAWYHDYTDYVIGCGLMHGVGGSLFDPNGAVTRAQMVTVLWNMSGDPVVNYYMTYSDVSESAWYAEAIRWATSEGVVDGYGNGKFGPNDLITREQMAVMLYRYEKKYRDGGFTGEWMYHLPFTDLDQISDWAFEAVAWCNMNGIITGKDGNRADPKGSAKRCEMAAVLTRYSEMNIK